MQEEKRKMQEDNKRMAEDLRKEEERRKEEEERRKEVEEENKELQVRLVCRASNCDDNMFHFERGLLVLGHSEWAGLLPLQGECSQDLGRGGAKIYMRGKTTNVLRGGAKLYRIWQTPTLCPARGVGGGAWGTRSCHGRVENHFWGGVANLHIGGQNSTV
jgi:hypothetical protein